MMSRSTSLLISHRRFQVGVHEHTRHITVLGHLCLHRGDNLRDLCLHGLGEKEASWSETETARPPESFAEPDAMSDGSVHPICCGSWLRRTSELPDRAFWRLPWARTSASRFRFCQLRQSGVQLKPLHMWLIFGATCILDSVWMLVFMAPHGSLMETVQILVAMPYMPLS